MGIIAGFFGPICDGGPSYITGATYGFRDYGRSAPETSEGRCNSGHARRCSTIRGVKPGSFGEMDRVARLGLVWASMYSCPADGHHGPFGILYPAVTAANRSRTCAADGLTSVVPSGSTTVGTVWLPPLTDITNSAAAGSCSMSTSAISIPSRASCFFRFRQKPHHGVVYIISWPDTRRLLEVVKLPDRVTPARLIAFPRGECPRDG